MEVQIMFLIVLLLFFGNGGAADNKTEIVGVDFTGTLERIQEGHSLVLTCEFNGSFNEQNDSMIIQKIGKLMELSTIATEKGLEPDAPENVEILAWLPNDVRLLVKVNDISRHDRGKYTCKVLRNQNDIVAEDTFTVDVLFSPSGKPSCETLPSKSIYNDGDKIILRCISDTGNPPVAVQWYREDNATYRPIWPEQQTTGKENDNTILELPVTLASNMNESVFECIRNNGENMTSTESCLIGPLTIVNKTNLDLGIDSAKEPTDGNSTNAAAIGSAAAGAVFIIVILILVIVFVVKPKMTKQKEQQPKKSRAIGAPQNYVKLSKIEEGEDNSANGTSDGQVYAVVQKPKGKEYPAPPEYPRPQKSLKRREETPYANTEIGSKTPGDTESVSPKSTSTKDNHEKVVYGNTLDLGPGVSKQPTSSNTSEYANTSDATANTSHLPAPTVSPPQPPDEVNNTP